RRASDTIDAFRYLVYDQFSYVRLLAKAGRQHEAEEARGQLQRDLTELIERSPGDALPLNNLAWLIVSFPDGPSADDARRAVELAEQAVALDGAKAAYWNTLGVARYRTGQLQGALAAFQESMRLNEGGDAYDWLFMAMIHERLGQFEEAR